MTHNLDLRSLSTTSEHAATVLAYVNDVDDEASAALSVSLFHDGDVYLNVRSMFSQRVLNADGVDVVSTPNVTFAISSKNAEQWLMDMGQAFFDAASTIALVKERDEDESV